MKLALVLVMACAPAWAGYAIKASIPFAAATGSTQTNITLTFTFNDPKLRTVANGGQIQNTVTRVGVTVPADLILTNDSTCNSLTGGWTWGIETYSPTAGTGVGKALVASLTTGASVVPTVCAGNAAIVTYQGGAQGSEFDGSTKAAYLFPDGTALSVKDFSSNSNDLSNPTSVGAVAGQIDGAAGVFDGTSQYLTKASAVVAGTPVTLSAWVKATNAPTGGGSVIVLFTTLDDNTWIRLAMQGGKVYGDRNSPSYASATGTTALSSGTWYLLTVTLDGSTLAVYVNGALENSSAYTGSNSPNSTAIGRINAAIGAYFGGSIDDAKLSNVVRSADWLATEYANQASQPAISAFTSLTASPRLLLLGVAE